MALFTEIDPAESDAAIEQAVERLCLAAAAHGFGPLRVWSLAELAPDDSDYRWLCRWAECLDPGTAERWLSDRRAVKTGCHVAPGEASIGLLLLFLFAEKARRVASEANLWSVLADGLFRGATQRLLFNSCQRYPRPRLQRALEAAAHHFNLRNVFSQAADVHAWKGLIFLQFGFSLRGVRAQLPNWLAGQGTQGVRRLFRGPLRSDSFRGLWNTLTDFRLGRLTAPEFKRRLAASPWVLDGWIEELRTKALHRRDSLGTRSLEDEDIEIPFLNEVQLIRNAGAPPRFRARFVADAVPLEEPGSYRLIIGSREVARVFVDGEGDARLDPPSEWVDLPRAAPSLPVSLRDAAGATQATMALDLWDRECDVVLCSWDGSAARLRGDAYEQPMVPGQRCAILAWRDLELSPPAEDWFDIPETELRLHLLGSRWAPSLALLWNGEVVWTPASPKNRAIRAEPEWAHRVALTALRSPRDRRARVTHPEDVRVRWARFAGQATDLSPGAPGETVIGPLPERAGGSGRVLLGVARGDEHAVLHRELRRPMEGAWLVGDAGWEPLDELPELDVGELGTRRLKVELPDNSPEKRRRRSLIEDASLLAPLPPGTLVLSGAAGLGGALRLRRDGYNSRDADLILCRSLVDRGNLRSVTETSEGWLLRLDAPNQPDEHSRVVWWSDAGLQSLHPQAVEPDLWRVECASEPLAVGVAYQGERLGAWWCDRWWDHLTKDLDVCLGGARLRWFRLPLLEPGAFESLRRFTRRRPVTLLAEWLTGEPPEGLEWTAARRQQWVAALRSVFWEWAPAPEQAGLLCRKLAADGPSHAEMVAGAALQLANWHPVLMARLLRALSPASPTCREAIRQVRDRLAGDEAALLERSRELMGVDPYTPADENFVRRRLLGNALQLADGSTLPADAERAIAMAVAVEPFRRLLALRLLQRLEG